MTTSYEIRATGSEFNMADWCAEKCEETLKGIARTLELLKTIEDTEKAQQELRTVLHHATKLYAFSCGGHWEFEHGQLVFDRGLQGVELLDKAYGEISETRSERRHREAQETFTRLEELLAGSGSPNRTQLHELLRAQRDPDLLKRLTRFREMLEQVTQGELSWSDFVGPARQELAARRCEADQPTN